MDTAWWCARCGKRPYAVMGGADGKQVVCPTCGGEIERQGDDDAVDDDVAAWRAAWGPEIAHARAAWCRDRARRGV